MATCSYLPHKNKEQWNKIKEILRITPTNFTELDTLFFKGKCLFFKAMSKRHENEAKEFLKIYNNLSKLALNLENILPEEIKLLKKDTIGIIELTRKEVALIFLLSFFNLIDVRQENLRRTNNFRVYELLHNYENNAFEFGRCFVNYLTTIGKWLSENNPILDEKISYIRDNIKFNNKIFEKETKLCDIEIHEKGSLFDRDDSYYVDFANKYIGGGALQGGCVQEEILFAVQPEAIVSMFFMEVMSENDAIRIDNTIQYSNYTGYGYRFKFKDCAIDFNNLKYIKKNKFIAIDACVQSTYKYGTFYKEEIFRDIHKAYVGFNLINFDKMKKEKKEEIRGKEIKTAKTEKKEKEDIIIGKGKIEEIKEGEGKGKDVKVEEKKVKKTENEKGEEKKDEKTEINDNSNEEKNISTGNWGCGVFGGDHELKFLQQWVAASFAGVKKLYYYTFESKYMKFVIKNLDKIKEKYNTANDLYKDLTNKTLCERAVLEILLEINNQENDDYGFNLLNIKLRNSRC